MAYENNTGYPSVTEILRPWVESDFYTEESQRRGESVHAACAAYLKGAYVPPLQEEYQPYFDSFLKWAQVAVESVIMVEERLSDSVLRFCGKPDAILCISGDVVPVVVDFKTSQSNQKWWRLQTAAYRFLAEIHTRNVATRRLSVRLKNDGSFAIVDEHKHPSDWTRFKHCLECFNFFKG